MFGFSNKGMDDGDGKCVGGIVGLGRSFHVEMQAHHFLHLGFVGVAVAGDGHFDLVRSIFENREAILVGDEQTNAASFCDGNTGSNVLLKKEFFDRHDFGMMLIDELVKRVINILEAVGKRGVCGRRNDAVIDGAGAFNDAKTTNARTWVDTENSTH